METLVVKAVESTVGEPVEIGRGARVAQLAEQGTLNPKVLGSIPGAGTIHLVYSDRPVTQHHDLLKRFPGPSYQAFVTDAERSLLDHA
jgi:hypothetical protein